MTCPVCGELVEAGVPFFETPDGRAHEPCVMRGRSVAHHETITIGVVDISKEPARCSACVDGLRLGERCDVCGGTGERDRVYKTRLEYDPCELGCEACSVCGGCRAPQDEVGTCECAALCLGCSDHIPGSSS